jgi:hypothetical protein
MALTIGLPPMATPEVSRQNSIRMLPHVEAELRRRQVKELANLAQPVLQNPSGLTDSCEEPDFGMATGLVL